MPDAADVFIGMAVGLGIIMVALFVAAAIGIHVSAKKSGSSPAQQDAQETLGLLNLYLFMQSPRAWMNHQMAREVQKEIQQRQEMNGPSDKEQNPGIPKRNPIENSPNLIRKNQDPMTNAQMSDGQRKER